MDSVDVWFKALIEWIDFVRIEGFDGFLQALDDRFVEASQKFRYYASRGETDAAVAG